MSNLADPGDATCGALGARGRGRPRDPEVEQQIAEATVGLVAEVGFDALTMDAVAKRAGVAKATLYRRFPAKVDLIVSACQWVNPVEPDVPDTGSVRDDLVEIVSAFADRLRRPETGRTMPSMVAASADNPEIREALRQVSEARRSRLLHVLRRGVDRGELADDLDLELLADTLTGPIAYRHLISGRSITHGVVARLVDQVLRGATPTPTPNLRTEISQ